MGYKNNISEESELMTRSLSDTSVVSPSVWCTVRPGRLTCHHVFAGHFWLHLWLELAFVSHYLKKYVEIRALCSSQNCLWYCFVLGGVCIFFPTNLQYMQQCFCTKSHLFTTTYQPHKNMLHAAAVYVTLLLLLLSSVEHKLYSPGLWKKPYLSWAIPSQHNLSIPRDTRNRCLYSCNQRTTNCLFAPCLLLLGWSF